MATKKEIDLKHRVKIFMVFRAWKQAGGGAVSLADLARAVRLPYRTVQRCARRLDIPVETYRGSSLPDQLPVDTLMKLNSGGDRAGLLKRAEL